MAGQTGGGFRSGFRDDAARVGHREGSLGDRQALRVIDVAGIALRQRARVADVAEVNGIAAETVDDVRTALIAAGVDAVDHRCHVDGLGGASRSRSPRRIRRVRIVANHALLDGVAV